MGVILTILKWIGIILLILLALILCIILLVLLVPFRYKAAAQVDDPESHSELELKLFKERSRASAEVSWLLGVVKVLADYPSKDLVTVKLFGKDIGLMEKLRKPKEEEPEEEKEEEPEKEAPPIKKTSPEDDSNEFWSEGDREFSGAADPDIPTTEITIVNPSHSGKKRWKLKRSVPAPDADAGDTKEND